jgi:hypothetical protein
MNHLTKPALFLAGLVLIAGCAVPVATKSQRVELSGALKALGPAVSPSEAKVVADAAYDYPRELAGEFHPVPPAVFNNILVNIGIHHRGLCFQWADDLTAKMMTLHLRTLELHRGVARLGTVHEHSCLVMTAPGQPFTNGIAFDAWRHCGRLNWSPVAADKYHWVEVQLTKEYQEQLEKMAANLETSRNFPEDSNKALPN